MAMDKTSRDRLTASLCSKDPSVTPMIPRGDEQIELLRSIAEDVKRIADVLTEWNRRGVPADRL